MIESSCEKNKKISFNNSKYYLSLCIFNNFNRFVDIFLVLLNFPSDDNDVVIGNILEIGLIVLSAFLIIYTLLCLVFAIVIAVFSTNNKIRYFEACNMNILTKCLQIPSYIANFIVALVGVLMSIWGLGLIFYAVIVDFLTIVLSGIASIGCTYSLKKNGIITKKMAIICGIGSFIYVFDIIVSIYYLIEKANYKLKKGVNI